MIAADGIQSLCPFPSVSPTGKPYSPHIPTLDELLAVPRDEVAARGYDLAAINLVCCADLPGAEHVDVPAYLAKLDEWASAIRVNTARNWHIFRRHPGDFGHTENQFRAIWMCYRMLKDYGVHYAASQHGRDNWSFGDPDNEFICGALGPKQTGTCACLPVLAVAVGRRLGFPLYLVSAPNHLFFRWEDPAERFNVEWGGEGAKTEADEHYYEWPVKWTPELHRYQKQTDQFLTNKTPAQELAYCLFNRSMVLRTLGRYEEALQALDAAERLDPLNVGYTEDKARIFCLLPEVVDLPWIWLTDRTVFRQRPNVVITPLYPLMKTMPWFFRVVESENMRDVGGPDVCVPLTAVVGVGPLFSANWYWDFHKDFPFNVRVEPAATDLLDALDVLRDRAKDPRHVNVRISRKHYADDEPLYLHRLKIISQRPQKKERAL